jgi:hypothetical protein
MRSTRPSPNDRAQLTRQEARRDLLMAGIGIATIAASFVYAPWVHNGPVLCPFRYFTGLPCPGCGLTRSFCAMSQGHFCDAMAFHILGPVLFAGLLVGIPLVLVQGLTRRRIRAVNSVLFSARLGYLAAATLAGFHLVRLIVMACQGTLWAGMGHSLIASVLRRVWE